MPNRPRIHELVRKVTVFAFCAFACGGTGHQRTDVNLPVPKGLLVEVRHGFTFAGSQYMIQVFRDGRVRYVGDSGVMTRGECWGRVDEAAMDDIDLVLNAFWVDRIAARYDTYDIEDAGWTTIVYVAPNGSVKRVYRYLGDMVAPAVLQEFVELIEKAVRVEQWTGTAQERAQPDVAQPARGCPPSGVW